MRLKNWTISIKSKSYAYASIKYIYNNEAVEFLVNSQVI